VVAWVVYISVYSKYKANFNRITSVYDKFCEVDRKIDAFNETQIRVSEKEDFIFDMMGYYKANLNPNEKILNSYKDKVLELLKQMEIYVSGEDIKQTPKDDGNIYLEFSFVANYDTFCKFLFELEQFTEIESVTYNYKGEANMKISPILYSSQVNSSLSGRTVIENLDDIARAGYFKTIADKLLSIKDIGYADTWRDIGHIPDSPFFRVVIEKKKKPKKYSAVVRNVEKPNIVIDGIMYEDTNPMVIIDGRFYYVGDKYKNAKIVKIQQNNIIVDCYGVKYTIKMEN
jgi:hypothetical protein